MISLSAPTLSDAAHGIHLRRRALYTASKPSSGLTKLAVAAIVIAGLYFGRDLFIPLALAILLSFALGPLVLGLRRAHLGRVPAVFAVVLLAMLALVSGATLIGSQLGELAQALPEYQYNIIQKIQSVKGIGASGGLIGQTSALLDRIGGELAKSTTPGPTTTPGQTSLSGHSAAKTPISKPPGQQAPQPVLVEIHQPAATPVAIILNVLSPLLGPFATAGIVIVFVVFFLLQREQLRDRFIRLVGAGDLRHTSEALDDAFRRLGRYLLTQTAINTGFGLIVGSGLWLIGIPNPVLWGVLGALLRFVPYIGAVIAACFPAALAIAIDPGWTTLLWTAALFFVVEGITGQVIEPFYYGRSTGLSAVAVVVATTFWTWLWGPIGLLLSMPLTLCLVVLGRHVAALEFLDILLGDEPALAPEEKFYQRMLAGDASEAAFQAEAFLKDNPLSAYYDDVAVKGLRLAQMDVNRGELDHERRVLIKDTMEALIDDLSDHAAPPEAAEPETAGDDETRDASGEMAERRDRIAGTPASSGLAGTPASSGIAGTPASSGIAGTPASSGIAGPPASSGLAAEQPAVLCIAGRGSLDEAVAGMLAQLLAQAGIGARVVASAAVSTANLARLDAARVGIVCLSYLEPGDFTNARYLTRRLRRRWPNARIVAGFWTWSAADTRSPAALENISADTVVTSLRQAVAIVGQAAGRPIDQRDARTIAGASSRATVSAIGGAAVVEGTPGFAAPPAIEEASAAKHVPGAARGSGFHSTSSLPSAPAGNASASQG